MNASRRIATAAETFGKSLVTRINNSLSILYIFMVTRATLIRSLFRKLFASRFIFVGSNKNNYFIYLVFQRMCVLVIMHAFT